MTKKKKGQDPVRLGGPVETFRHKDGGQSACGGGNGTEMSPLPSLRKRGAGGELLSVRSLSEMKTQPNPPRGGPRLPKQKNVDTPPPADKRTETFRYDTYWGATYTEEIAALHAFGVPLAMTTSLWGMTRL